jgi:hypothetical protein
MPELTVTQVRSIRRCIHAARLNIRLAWAGALDEAGSRQLILAEAAMGEAEAILGPEPGDAPQPWEASA